MWQCKIFFHTPRTCCLFLVPIIFLVNLNPQFVPNLSLENYISGKPVEEFSMIFFQFSMCNYHSQCKTPPFKAQKLLGNKQLEEVVEEAKEIQLQNQGTLTSKSASQDLLELLLPRSSITSNALERKWCILKKSLPLGFETQLHKSRNVLGHFMLPSS